MCLCCEVAVYVNKFMGTIDIYIGLKYMLISLLFMTIIEVILTIVGIFGGFTEDLLTEILFYMTIVVSLYASLWTYISYKTTTADLLLVTEYATLMVPLPCLSLFGYTLLTYELFFYVDHIFQILFSVFSLYYSIVIHSLYIDRLYIEQEEKTSE